MSGSNFDFEPIQEPASADDQVHSANWVRIDEVTPLEEVDPGRSEAMCPAKRFSPFATKVGVYDLPRLVFSLMVLKWGYNVDELRQVSPVAS